MAWDDDRAREAAHRIINSAGYAGKKLRGRFQGGGDVARGHEGVSRYDQRPRRHHDDGKAPRISISVNSNPTHPDAAMGQPLRPAAPPMPPGPLPGPPGGLPLGMPPMCLGRGCRL